MAFLSRFLQFQLDLSTSQHEFVARKAAQAARQTAQTLKEEGWHARICQAWLQCKPSVPDLSCFGPCRLSNLAALGPLPRVRRRRSWPVAMRPRRCRLLDAWLRMAGSLPQWAGLANVERAIFRKAFSPRALILKASPSNQGLPGQGPRVRQPLDSFSFKRLSTSTGSQFYACILPP